MIRIFDRDYDKRICVFHCDYKEGAGLIPINDLAEYSYVRNLVTGRPKDTGNNAADFMLVATSPASIASATAILGAAGPEGGASLVQHNLDTNSTLIEPALLATQSPNRIRTETGNSGTLAIRRRFTNNTGLNVTRLRFRIVDITTLNSAGHSLGGGQADLRAISSTDTTVTTTLGLLTIKGLTLETPPAISPAGGGLNNRFTVDIGGPALSPGASINVQFVLQIVQTGTFRIYVNVEGLP